MADNALVETLDEAQCLKLIETGYVGRLAYASRYGPAVLPVNYRSNVHAWHATTPWSGSN